VKPNRQTQLLKGMKEQNLMPRFAGRSALVPFFVIAATLLLLGAGVGQAHAVSVPLYTISQTNSGLVASDPLDATLSQSQLSSSSFWYFGGDAVGEGVPYAFSEDSGGLHIGVSSPTGEYAGLYATHSATAMLAHAQLTAPSATVPNGYPNVGLYVQTGGTNVDYVFCGPVVSSAGIYWEVAMATGGTTEAFTYQPLYVNEAANQPLSMGCTIDTNGQNFLAVYLDGSQVYTNSELNLGYQQPFQFFLETQTSDTSGMFTGTFQDFYLTSSDSLMVTGMPSGSTAQIVSSSGQVLASSAASSGTATLEIAQYNMPLVANIQVTSALGVQIASTSSPVSIWGGDAYSLSLLGIGAAALTGSGPNVSSSAPAVASSANAAVQSAASQAAPTVAAPSSNAAGPVTSAVTTPLSALSLVAGFGGATLSEADERTHHGSRKTSKSSSGQEEDQ
jgi:hypothetical protein